MIRSIGELYKFKSLLTLTTITIKTRQKKGGLSRPTHFTQIIVLVTQNLRNASTFSVLPKVALHTTLDVSSPIWIRGRVPHSYGYFFPSYTGNASFVVPLCLYPCCRSLNHIAYGFCFRKHLRNPYYRQFLPRFATFGDLSGLTSRGN